MKFTCNRAMALLVISSTFLLTITDCKKSNNSGVAIGSMSASINGTAWANSYPLLGFYTLAASSGTFQIYGFQVKGGDSTSFELNFVSPPALNQTISTNNPSSYFSVDYSDYKSGTAYTAMFGVGGHAILTVTSYDTLGQSIGGTFSGVLYNTTSSSDSMEVTNGKFNSTFQIN